MSNPVLKYSITVDDAIGSYVDSDKLESIDMYVDGMIARYQGVSEPLTLKVLEIVPNKQYVIDVNSDYNFTLTIDDGNLPWWGDDMDDKAKYFLYGFTLGAKPVVKNIEVNNVKNQ